MAIPQFRPGFCNLCNQPIGTFRDVLSRTEFSISGMCQACQDSAFAAPEDEDEDEQGCDCCCCTGECEA